MSVSKTEAGAWTEKILAGAPEVRAESLGRALANWKELVERGQVAPVMAAAATLEADDPRLGAIFKALGDGEAEEAVGAALEAGGWSRAAGLALALRHGGRLEGGPGELLQGELDVLDAEDPADVEALDGALGLLASLAPAEALEMAGLCAEAAVDWLERQPPPRGHLLVGLYAARLAPALLERRLPEPAEVHGLLVMELLDGALASGLLSGLAERAGLPIEEVASALLRATVEVGMAVAGQSVPVAEAAGDASFERLDADIVRGLLDHHQIAYNDLTGDTWRAVLRHKNAFDEKVSTTLSVGLTARRLTMRVVLVDMGHDPRALLKQNHTLGLARFTIDHKDQICASVELSRDGYSVDSFEQALKDLIRALEWYAQGP